MNLIGRRHVISAASYALAGSPSSATDIERDWLAFERRFVLPEGRIVDTGNRNISHSEGQGYGLLGAVRANDHTTFERILSWTVDKLRRPSDALFAWRWQPDSNPNVTDLNNATDGDVHIAWALSIAAERWSMPTYRRLAQAITRDLLRRCVVNVGSRWVLLSGAYGFESRQRVVVNLSYYAFAALRVLARHVPDPVWGRLEQDGLDMIRDSQFGMWQLPPDWLELPREGGRPRLAQGWPARFSFDAVRIPLNLCWAGLVQEPAVSAAAAYWFSRMHRQIPAWTDLMTGVVAPYPAAPGTVAIARLTVAAMAGRGDLAIVPAVASAADYYSAALVMKTRMAWQDLTLTGAGP